MSEEKRRRCSQGEKESPSAENPSPKVSLRGQRPQFRTEDGGKKIFSPPGEGIKFLVRIALRWVTKILVAKKGLDQEVQCGERGGRSETSEASNNVGDYPSEKRENSP